MKWNSLIMKKQSPISWWLRTWHLKQQPKMSENFSSNLVRLRKLDCQRRSIRRIIGVTVSSNLHQKKKLWVRSNNYKIHIYTEEDWLSSGVWAMLLMNNKRIKCKRQMSDNNIINTHQIIILLVGFVLKY